MNPYLVFYLNYVDGDLQLELSEYLRKEDKTNTWSCLHEVHSCGRLKYNQALLMWTAIRDIFLSVRNFLSYMYLPWMLSTGCIPVLVIIELCLGYVYHLL